MDVERTIEFLLQPAARHDARMTRFEETQARNFAAAEKRFARGEKETESIKRLLREGFQLMKEVVRMQKESRVEMKELRALFGSTGRKNGHGSKS